MRVKDLKLVALHAADVRKLVSEAKNKLSGSQIPTNKRLTAEESQAVWGLLDQADAILEALVSYVTRGGQ